MKQRDLGRGSLRTAGFTITELLVVIAVVILIVAILIPVVGSVRKKADHVVGASNLRQVVSSMILYAQDHNGAFPPSTPDGEKNESYRLQQLVLAGYVSDMKILINPVNEAERPALCRHGVFRDDNCYFIARNVVASKWGRPWADVKTPETVHSDLGVPLVWDQRCDLYNNYFNAVRTSDGRWGGYFGYADGSVELLGYPDRIVRQ